jgi:hypothetical protein
VDPPEPVGDFAQGGCDQFRAVGEHHEREARRIDPIGGLDRVAGYGTTDIDREPVELHHGARQEVPQRVGVRVERTSVHADAT